MSTEPIDLSPIDVQVACDEMLPLSEERIRLFVQTVLDAHPDAIEAHLTVRLVDITEITQLNSTYRNMQKPTNVLAFPSTIPKEIPIFPPFLGDIVISPTVLAAEAEEQQRPLEAHWAHITMHGVLHLLGYEHEAEDDTQRMQAMEVRLLDQLGFSNPYATEEKDSDCV